MRSVALFLALLILGSALLAFALRPDPAQAKPAGPVGAESVPTRAQVRSAAYALQAQISAAAGRKTSAATDGGTPLTAPDEITSDTAWVHRTVSFSRRMYLNITGAETPPVTKALNLWINNSILYANNESTLLYPTLNVNNPCCYNTIPWTINVYITNSTVRDFGNLTLPFVNCLYCGYMQGSAFNLYFDNSTFTDIGFTATTLPYNYGTSCDIQFHFCDSFVHDSTFDQFNTFCQAGSILWQNDAGHPDKGYADRNRFTNPSCLTFGDAIAYYPRARWNYIDGTVFNGIVMLQRYFGGQFDGAALGNGEMVNYSYNYFTGTRIVEFGHHTSIGIYGSEANTGNYFQSPMFTSGQYATVYKNYVNNSRYIQYQTGGNTSNLYFINNYFGNGGPTFTEAWGLDSRTHNVTLDSNYIFDDISTGYYTNGVCCHGIVMSGFEYNMTIKNNVLYDIGGYGFEVGSQGLKFKDSGGTERSDYTYRAAALSFTNNYVDGINYYGIFQDSGYTTWSNNTLTNLLSSPNAGHYIDIVDGWCPSGLGAQIDWRGGTDFTGHTSDLHFTNSGCNITNFERQKLVWIRTLRGGTVGIQASSMTYGVHYKDNASTGFWGRTFDCVQEQTPSTATYWTQLPCAPMEDAQNFTYSDGPDYFAWRPQLYWNYTRAFSGPAVMSPLLKIDYTIPVNVVFTVTDTTASQTVPYWVGSVNVNMDAGHNYHIDETPPSGGGPPPPPPANNTTASPPQRQPLITVQYAAGIGALVGAGLLVVARPKKWTTRLLLIGATAALAVIALWPLIWG